MLEFMRRMVSGGNDGAREKKSAYPVFAFQGAGLANWSANDIGSLAIDGYGRNPVVYRCVRMVGEAAASVPLLVYEGSSELVEHPAMQLLGNPNRRQAGAEFLETVYGHLMVAGNAYVERVDLDTGPAELHPLRPDRVRIIADHEGWPTHYEYSNNGRAVRYVVPEHGAGPILHLMLFNPADELCGMPPLRAAHMAFDIHNSSSRWNKALLDNSARPSGALVYNSGDGINMTDDQYSRLKRELEDGYSGAVRAGRPLLLEGGLDWKAMSYSPRDMDFMEARNGSARDIALAFGVPPMLLGIPGDNTYANYKEANLAFWRQTVLPLVNRTCGALGRWLANAYEADLKLVCDLDQVPALASERETTWGRLGNADFLTVNEKREALGYEPMPANEHASRKPADG